MEFRICMAYLWINFVGESIDTGVVPPPGVNVGTLGICLWNILFSAGFCRGAKDDWYWFQLKISFMLATVYSFFWMLNWIKLNLYSQSGELNLFVTLELHFLHSVLYLNIGWIPNFINRFHFSANKSDLDLDN